MTVRIEIEMDNEAFTDNTGGELARILRKLAARLDGAELTVGDEMPLIDANGNRVGEFEIARV